MRLLPSPALLPALFPALLLLPSLPPGALAKEPKEPAAREAAASEKPAGAVSVSVKVVPGQVRFETTQFDVTAGLPVELTFSNGCIMPHNLVLIEPDAEGALIAGVNALGLEGMDKHFVPAVPGIIAATKLLQPQAREVLNFTAPKKPGDYPYLCTFPGHWFTMRGVMRVREAGAKLAGSVKSAEKIQQVEDALKNSGMSHKPLGTPEKAYVMRTFAPDPGLDPAVFANHGTGRDAFKYDPATRQDVTRKETDPATGKTVETPIVIPSLKGVAGAIAVNHGKDFSYVWDSTECRLLYVWRGGFLDMDTYWGKEPGSGRPKVYLPLIMGRLVYRASGAMPLAQAGDPAPVFLGYRMVGGAPEFRYRLGGRVYREKIASSAAGGFEVRVLCEDGASAPVWKVASADAAVASVRNEKGAVVVAVQDRPEPEQQAPAKEPSDKTKKK
jgi:azurin